MQTIDAMIKEAQELIGDAYVRAVTPFQEAMVVAVLESCLIDAFKQLPVAEVQKVLDKLKKVRYPKESI